ncbi:MAG: glycosyltransferase family 4 protein [Planctomycetota bacterium]
MQSVAPKRILLIHRWFWPDAPPYASMLRSIGRQLVKDGHEVTVLTAQPSYNKATAGERCPKVGELDGMTVVRVGQMRESKRNFLMRGLNMLLFMFHIRRFILRQTKMEQGPFDSVMATTMPPVLVAATARRAARKTGARFLYHMMDIYPEIAWASGLAKKNFFTRWLAKVDGRNCSEADRVIVLSRDMRDSIRRRNVPTDNVVRLNNFRLESFTAESEAAEALAKIPLDRAAFRVGATFPILFAGNLGRFQGLEEILSLVREILPECPGLQLHFLGEGVKRKALEEASGDDLNRFIFFHGHVSSEEAAIWTRRAALNLVTLQPEIIRYAYPSKTSTCLCMGSPILAVVEGNTDLANLLTKTGAGFVVKQGDREKLNATIQYAYAHREPLEVMRERALQVGKEHFNPETVLPQWTQLYNELFRSSP